MPHEVADREERPSKVSAMTTRAQQRRKKRVETELPEKTSATMGKGGTGAVGASTAGAIEGDKDSPIAAKNLDDRLALAVTPTEDPAVEEEEQEPAVEEEDLLAEEATVDPPAVGDAASLAVENQDLKSKLERSQEENRRLKLASTAEAKRKKAAGKDRYWEKRSMKKLSCSNQTSLHRYIKEDILPRCKFFPTGWHRYSATMTTSMSYLFLVREAKDSGGKKLGHPQLVKPARDARSLEEWWYQDVVPAVVYKRGQLLNSLLTQMGKKYICKWPPFFMSRSL